MAEQIREKRATESRASFERPSKWMPASLLPDPEPEAGWAFRWIRLATLNNPDPSNISSKLREGWEPVKSADQPRLQLLSNPNGRFPDGIEIGGLLLCKTPSEFVDQRTKHFSGMTRAQEEAVDNNLMRQSDARMPIFNERKSSTSFGKGT